MSKTEQSKALCSLLFLSLVYLISTPYKDIKAAEHGIASYYHEGQYIACGVKHGKSQIYNPDGISAAHKTLPCGTKVKVTRKDTGKSIVLTITDRGPYIPGRIIDLSRGAAKKMDMLDVGIVPVSVAKL